MRSIWRVSQVALSVSITPDDEFGQPSGECEVLRRSDELCLLSTCRAPGAMSELQLRRSARGLDAD